jgi:hypothetical protein
MPHGALSIRPTAPFTSPVPSTPPAPSTSPAPSTPPAPSTSPALEPPPAGLELRRSRRLSPAPESPSADAHLSLCPALPRARPRPHRTSPPPRLAPP